jgi:mRNA-degrading endonuclease toxin of MazEF toxin-antitoxin module
LLGGIQRCPFSLPLSRFPFPNRLEVVPLTTTADRLYPSEALVTVRRKQHRTIADQLTTVSKRRLQNRAGRLSKIDMGAVEQAIKVQLELTKSMKAVKIR